MAVDVSGSMRWLIDTVVDGISGINAVLNNEDLVSVLDFAETQRTIFGYLKRARVDWDNVRDTLRTDAHRSNCGAQTALWDVIGYVLDTTPHNRKYSVYKPEIVIFTDGHDNCSTKHSIYSIQEAIRHPGISHVHITIIDASQGGNPQLRWICGETEHCSYVPVQAFEEVVARAFVEVTAAGTKRLTISIDLSGDTMNALASTFNQLAIEPAALPSTEDGETNGGRERGRGRGGRGRGSG
ncbi:Hypothetical protein NCS54_00573600 [Fusarium falciforme]|uniref:Hypothetical protein n=1 Tax=Fusarium falciforme TaxID=195108 RepID=UPI002300D8A0|nr:Hypothetical protein NCS54_00573600 [Fusarium falciforme]WAO88389.1 Hypothetical protein NCS54_00573600 [Fusarium falciforme]